MPDIKLSLVSLEGLAEPAVILVQKVSGALGILHEPKRILNKAKAKAEAKKIMAAAHIEIGEMEERALQSLVERECRRQENIKAITYKAIEDLNETADPSKIDDDWLVNFLNKCSSISNEEMQSLWAKILAGEANKSGSFRKRTIEQVSMLEKTEADSFSKLCSFFVTAKDGIPVPIVRDVDDEIYRKQGFVFIDLQHLNSIGLIIFEPNSGFRLRKLGKSASFKYFGTHVDVTFSDDGPNSLTVGHVSLTIAGEELAPIAGASPNNDFLPYLKSKYAEEEVEITF